MEATVLFVDRDAIAELNRGFLGGAGPTDVLSFPIDGELIDPGRNPDAGPPAPTASPPRPTSCRCCSATSVICPAVAAANAPDHAGTLDDELALLVVHGLLHLLGHDHAEPTSAGHAGARARAAGRVLGPLAADPWVALERSLGDGSVEAPPPAAGGHPAAGESG